MSIGIALRSAAFSLIAIMTLCTYAARGEGYSIMNILSTKTPVPEGSRSFLGTNLAVYLGNGLLAFRAAGGQGQAGIYTYKDGEIAKLIDKNSNLPGSEDKFSNFGSPVSLGGGNFAFIGTGASGQKGIYGYVDGKVSVIVDNMAKVADSNEKYTDFQDLREAGPGEISFKGKFGESNYGLYLYKNGKIITIAETGKNYPSLSVTFNKLKDPVYLGIEGYAFKGSGKDKKSGIYIFSGGKLKAAVDSDMPVEGLGRKLRSFGNPVSTTGGDFVFTARSKKGGSAIYRYSKGKLTEVAGKNTLLSVKDDKQVMIRNISRDPVVLKNGEVVFQASGAGDVRGIYASGKGGMRVIADTSTAIPRGEGNFRSFVRSQALPGGGLVFKALGTEGQDGLYVSKGDRILMVADKNTDLTVGYGKFIYFGDFEPTEEDNFIFYSEGNNAQIGLYKAAYEQE